MLRVFSGSCLSLEDMETVRRPALHGQPHELGPGFEYFRENGEPVRPQPSAHTLRKVFSGSVLDLNAMNGDILSEEEVPQLTSSWQCSDNSQQQALQGATVSTILNQLSSETEKERAKSAKSKTNVLLIGDVGYTSSHIVAKLLDAGYSVRMTVPDKLNQQQQMGLYPKERDTENRLFILEADMTNSATLRDAMRGCKYIIHCGCTVTPDVKDIVGYHVNAVQALFDAIRGVGKSTVKRVVITGAATSVFHITDPDPPSGAFDESCWNTVATALTEPAPFARICFEKEAWRLKQMLGVELVVILPSMIIGPSRSEEISDAMVRIQELATAPRYLPYASNLCWNYVDVRDVAEAHVRALECQEVRDQRVIVSNGCFSYAELAKMIKERYPHLTPPTRTANTFLTLLLGPTQHRVKMGFLWRSLGVRKKLQTHRATADLGLKLTPMTETIRACIDQMIQIGEVPAPSFSRERGGYVWVVATVAAGLSLATAVVCVVARAKQKRT